MHEPRLAPSVDACWLRIGARGDGSCPQLQQYIRCRNCPTHAEAATIILDATPPSDNLHEASDASTRPSSKGNETTQSALIFRVGNEWLALPTDTILEVAMQNTIHSLPHQTNRAILGLANIRGALLLCVSLERMLHADAASGLRNTPRFLVTAHQAQKIVFPVDEVHGIERFDSTTLLPAPSTIAQSTATYTQAILPWQSRKVGLLDRDLLFYALNRSLI